MILRFDGKEERKAGINMKNRLIAMLLTLTLVLTYMPALVFADSVEDSTAAESVKVETEGKTGNDLGHVKKEAANEGNFSEVSMSVTLAGDRELTYDYATGSVNFPEAGDIITIDFDSETVDYVYKNDEFVSEDGSILEEWDAEPYDGELCIEAKVETEDDAFWVETYLACTFKYDAKSISFSPANITLYSEDVKTNDGLYDFWNRGARDGEHPFISGDKITVNYVDGRVITYSYIETTDEYFTFVNGSDAIHAYPNDDWLVPGNNTFNVEAKGRYAPVTVFLDTPAARAQRAAAAAAQAAAAAEAARQGTFSASLPKVTASKPAAAKKAVTVKWKKLNKKNQKKASKIEVWVCPNKAFGAADTIMKQVSKKKASVKVKGLGKKKTYFVKVRSIKYVGGVKMVGKWSKVKKVKTK